MKRFHEAAVAACLGLVLGWQAADAGGDKVHSVGDGLKIEGRVKPDDAKVKVEADGNVLELPAQPFQVKMSAGKKYIITMDSAEFDSFLVIHDPAGKQIGFDDD